MPKKKPNQHYRIRYHIVATGIVKDVHRKIPFSEKVIIDANSALMPFAQVPSWYLPMELDEEDDAS